LRGKACSGVGFAPPAFAQTSRNGISQDPFSAYTGDVPSAKLVFPILLSWFSSCASAQTLNGGQNPIYAATPVSIQIVNPATNEIVGRIPFGAYNLTFSPDGRLGYAARSALGVQIVDLQTRQAIDSIEGDWVIEAVAVAPDGARLAMIDNYSRSVLIVDLRTKQVLATIPVGLQPGALAFTPNGRKLYVSDHDDDALNPRVYVIDGQSLAIVGSIPVPDYPTEIAMAPDGERAYVVCGMSSEASALVVIDTRTDRVVGRISLPAGATNISIDHQERYGYVSHGGSSGAGISIVSLRTNTLITTVLTGDQTYGGTVSEDGDFVYASLIGAQRLIVLDTATRQIVGSQPLDGFTVHTATPWAPGPAIRLASCVVRHGGRSFTAHFSYWNDTGSAWGIPVGDGNAVSPGPLNVGQPVEFHQWREPNAFRLEFDGTPVKWAVASPSGSTYWTTADRSPMCR